MNDLEQKAGDGDLVTETGETRDLADDLPAAADDVEESLTGPEAEEEAPPIDLNTATAEELQTLPGVGQVLAQRIVEYRQSVGWIEETGEIIAVPGISEAMHDRLVSRLTVAPQEVEHAPEDVYWPEEVPIIPLQPEEDAGEAKETPTTRRSRAEEEPPLVQVVARPAGWGRMLLVGLFSAIAGAVLALVFLFMVNGTLDFQAAAQRTIRGEVEQIEGDLQSLRGELGQVEARLELLDELAARLESAQAGIDQLGRDLESAQSELASTSDLVGALRQEFTNLREDLDGMTGLVSGMGQRMGEAEAQLSVLNRTVEAMSESVERFDLFMNGLLNLLNRTLEGQRPTATPWLTPTPSSAVTVIPQATSTPSGQ